MKDDRYKITCVRDRQGLGAILESWQKLQDAEENPVPGVDPQHYISELDSLGSSASPYIICLYRGSQLESMLIGRLQGLRMPMRFGYLILMKIPLKQVHIFHRGVLGQKNKEICSLLIRTLKEFLNSGNADVAVFNHLRCSSVMYGVTSKETPFHILNHSPRIDGHWTMEIPKSVVDFYAKKSSKERQTLQRKIRKLEKSHSPYMKLYSDIDDLKKGISDAAVISQKTYQHALEGGFVDNPQTQDYLAVVAKHGWLRLYIFYIDQQAVAFEWGLVYGNTFFLRTLGFSPEWRNWSVGTVLFLKVLESLCSEKNIKVMDFGFGDAEYKKTYGDNRSDTKSVFIFANRFLPISVSVFQKILLTGWMAAAYVTGKLGFERKIKRSWRDRLRRRQLVRIKERSHTSMQDSKDLER